MAKGQKLKTIAVRNNNTGQVAYANEPNKGVALTGTNIVGKTPRPNQSTKSLMPNLSLATRYSPYIAMCQDPVANAPALPPISMPARALPLKQYQEVLLTTDASGNASARIQVAMKSHYQTAATWSGTSVATWNTAVDNVEATSFTTNFVRYIPLVMEVRMKYTGAANVVAGRMYGIVSPGPSGSTMDVTTFPLEPNGCEAVTSDGISCTWYSHSAVWNNPADVTSTSVPTEWSDPYIYVALVGGPASVTNLLTVGVYLHLAAIPRPGICGLTPRPALPDPHVAQAAGLFQAADSGVGGSAMSIVDRNRARKGYKGHIRDALTVGGKVVGTLFPHLGAAATAAEALALLLA